MEQKKLITRSVSLQDERQKIIALTGKGRALLDQATDIPVRLGCQTGIDEVTVHALRQDIERLYERLSHAIERTRHQEQE
jgi:DNA-binding MarR family transcriptional regulator